MKRNNNNKGLSPELFMHEIKYLYSAETQLIEALPKIAGKVVETELVNILEDHIRKSAQHLERLEKIGIFMNSYVTGKTCYAIKALIDETEEIIQTRANSHNITDMALVAACMRIEKYEIARYKSALYMALLMDLTEVALLIHTTLHEEKEADALLTKLALEQVHVKQQKEHLI